MALAFKEPATTNKNGAGEGLAQINDRADDEPHDEYEEVEDRETYYDKADDDDDDKVEGDC